MLGLLTCEVIQEHRVDGTENLGREPRSPNQLGGPEGAVLASGQQTKAPRLPGGRTDRKREISNVRSNSCDSWLGLVQVVAGRDRVSQECGGNASHGRMEHTFGRPAPPDAATGGRWGSLTASWKRDFPFLILGGGTTTRSGGSVAPPSALEPHPGCCGSTTTTRQPARSEHGASAHLRRVERGIGAGT